MDIFHPQALLAFYTPHAVLSPYPLCLNIPSPFEHTDGCLHACLYQAENCGQQISAILFNFFDFNCSNKYPENTLAQHPQPLPPEWVS